MGIAHREQLDRHHVPAPPNAPAVRDIVAACAAEWRTTPALIYGPRRQQNVALPRQAAMHFAVALRPDLSIAVIGRLFHRDRTTINHAVRRVSWRAPRDDAFGARLLAVETRLRGDVLADAGSDAGAGGAP